MGVGDSAFVSHGTLLGYGLESTWGTLASATVFMEFTSQTFKKNIEKEKVETLGTGRNAIRIIPKNISVEGTLAWNLHPVDGIDILKQAMMGTVTSAISTATAYTHTFTAGDLSTITEQGLSFDVKPSSDTTTAFQFLGCRVNTYKISAAVNEVVKAEATFVGKDATSTAFLTTTASYSPVNPLVFHQGTFTVDGTTETIIGFEMTIENNLVTDNTARSLGSQLLTALPPARRNVTMTITQRFDTTTAYDRFISNSQAAIALIFDTGQTVGSDVLTYSMRVDLKKVHYNSGGPPEISEVGILTHEVELIAIGDTTTSAPTDLTFTVVNSATSI